MRYFAAIQGRTIRFVTVGVSVLLIAAILYGGKKFLDGQTSGAYVSAICSLVLVSAYLLSVRGYGIDHDLLTIKRPLSTTSIAMSQPVSIEAIEGLPGAIRVFGIGGLFSAVGIYYSRRIGWFRSYVSDTGNVLLIESANRKYVISPQDSKGFISEFTRLQTRAG